MYFVNLTISCVSEWNQLIAEIATLKKKVQEQQDAKMRIESMLTYVEDQLAIFQAAPPAATPLSLDAVLIVLSPPSTHAFGMFSRLNNLLTELSGQCIKVIWILDPSKFHEKPGINLIPYCDWLLQMQNKLRVNKCYILIKLLKITYLQRCVADNALA